jgi:alkanesulfonate monooxygenase SsuD/methylene tetrahydromethanopterin reductase-like flavin-dependent oxidoreductase (luciferase family)
VAEIARLLADPELAPPPAQRPVPLWMGAVKAVGARRAGRLGAGMLSLDRRLLEPYREGLEEAGKSAAEARMGGLVELILADDPEAARARLRPHREHQMESYASFRDDRDARVAARHDELLVLEPAAAAAEIARRTEGLPATDVYLWLSVGGMPDDLVDRQLELLAGPLRDDLTAGGQVPR